MNNYPLSKYFFFLEFEYRRKDKLYLRKLKKKLF